MSLHALALPQLPPQPADVDASPVRELPAVPRCVRDTGLSPLLLGELLLKVMQQHGLQHLRELAQHLKLSAAVLEELLAPMRRDALVDVRLRGARDGDVAYELTQAGRERALDAFARSQYSGAAPVPLQAYAERVQAQSVASLRVTRQTLDEALSDAVIDDALRERLGTAMNAQGAVMLYGPAGAGKTFLCGRLARLLHGAIAVPHAVEVGGEVIRVHDPLVHRALRSPDDLRGGLDNRERCDQRWVLCERPVVVTGGELTLEMLDLVFDPRAGYYNAPPHFKANNGVFLVDDLGRQVVTPRQLLNRWLLPMEQRVDYLMLRNGAKFRIPFDTRLFFSTNLPPSELADDAFLRRIGSKLHVGAASADNYRTLVRRACDAHQVAFDEAAFQHLLTHWHARTRQPLLACIPRDLLAQVAQRAAYFEEPPQLRPDALDRAWQTYFASENAS